MIQAKCIQKFRDKQNRIYGYRLQDINGQTQDVKTNDLKNAILNNKISIVNLTLTSDGRLVDKNTEVQLKNKKIMTTEVVKTDLENVKDKIIHKAKYIGTMSKVYPLIEYSDYDDKEMMSTSISESEYISSNIRIEFWMHIKPNSISFEVQETIEDDEEEIIDTGFKHTKQYSIDVLNTPNEKLLSLENNYKVKVRETYTQKK